MTPFNYIYHETECKGNYLPSDKAKGCIKVIFHEHSAIIIPTGIPTRNGQIIWVQLVQPGEAVWPHDLIQIMGEALSAAATPV
jgi:hypothetical protein